LFEVVEATVAFDGVLVVIEVPLLGHLSLDFRVCLHPLVQGQDDSEEAEEVLFGEVLLGEAVGQELRVLYAAVLVLIDLVQDFINFGLGEHLPLLLLEQPLLFSPGPPGFDLELHIVEALVREAQFVDLNGACVVGVHVLEGLPYGPDVFVV